MYKKCSFYINPFKEGSDNNIFKSLWRLGYHKFINSCYDLPDMADYTWMVLNIMQGFGESSNIDVLVWL